MFLKSNQWHIIMKSFINYERPLHTILVNSHRRFHGYKTMPLPFPYSHLNNGELILWPQTKSSRSCNIFKSPLNREGLELFRIPRSPSQYFTHQLQTRFIGLFRPPPLSLSLCLCMCVQAPIHTEEGARFPRAGVTGWYGCWELNSSSPREQWMLLTTEPSLHSIYGAELKT